MMIFQLPPLGPMSKRAICSNCERPQTTCICDALITMECNYQLIILQDPTESRHALSSAPILEKSIRNTRLLIGEIFDPEKIIGPDWQSCSVLIFPSEHAVTANPLRDSQISTVILLDGTWKKARRLMHLNPWLRELPTFALQPDQLSKYKIRKSPRTDGLSTIEAAVCVLNELQPEKDFSGILAAFHKMIELQITAMGEDTFKKNYPPS
ncbi:MAG: DTW domain-containing protein YfiP [Bacteroidia bacterium]|jgi:DTW domain-containing protein YfiP